MNRIRPTLSDVRAAHERIGPYIHRTPVLTCRSIDEMVGGRLFFKCENFQKGGAFKFRGATNAVFSLTDPEAARGVVTHSSGNHAQALALAGRLRKIQVHIVMPSNSSAVKQAAVRGYGANITFCQPTLQARESTALSILQQTGGSLIHPYDDLRVIAGQGTAAIELLEEVPELDSILVPLGGGGLLSGTLIAAKNTKPKIEIIGCEPRNADDAYRSLQAGKILPPERTDTVADGLRTGLGEKTFPIISELVDEICLASEDEILKATRMIFERMKIVVEPSAAVPLAVLMTGKITPGEGKTGIILSGGNVDMTRLSPMIRG